MSSIVSILDATEPLSLKWLILWYANFTLVNPKREEEGEEEEEGHGPLKVSASCAVPSSRRPPNVASHGAVSVEMAVSMLPVCFLSSLTATCHCFPPTPDFSHLPVLLQFH